MASVAELAPFIGRKGQATIAGLQVPVTVTDARERYGKIDLLVTPIGGSGETWVHRDNVELEPVADPPAEGQGT